MRTILIADDHTIIRRGLRALIDSHFGRSVWIEVDRTTEIMPALKSHSVTHAVLDMQLLDANLLDILPNLKSADPHLPMLVYSMSSEEIYAPKLLHLGIQCFLSKQVDEPEVIAAFSNFFSGKKYFSDKLKNTLDNPASSNPLKSLSERELSVLNYLLKGKTVKDISEIMHLKGSTVATYKARIFDKLEVSNTIDLRRIADLHHYEGS
jgi:two-component system invasion response regulator UvrY